MRGVEADAWTAPPVTPERGDVGGMQHVEQGVKEALSLKQAEVADCETDDERYAVRAVKFIRDLYLRRELEGTVEIGRTVGASTAGAYFKVSEEDLQHELPSPHPEALRQAISIPLAKVVESQLQGMQTSALDSWDSADWASLSRTFELSLNPLGLRLGYGLKVHVRASVKSLRAAELRERAAREAMDERSSSTSESQHREGWYPGKFVSKAAGVLSRKGSGTLSASQLEEVATSPEQPTSDRKAKYRFSSGSNE